VTDERWTRVKALFQAAIDRPTEERSAFVAAAAAGDDMLRREVESRLKSDAADIAAVDQGVLTDEDVHADVPMMRCPSIEAVHACVSLSPGSRLGPYEVVAPLGAGAMGEVYRARDAALGRDVALKVLPQAFAVDPDRIARFRREAHLLAALNHPNIAVIYGVEESTGTPTLVLELVEGPTLADRISRGAIPLEEALPIARQIVEALEAAHEQGIIHRDLKPSNVKVRPDGLAKVLDFGLAKVLASDPATRAVGALTQSPHLSVGATHEGIILGTAAYMSPEQAKRLAVDKRTDIWSFGCVLFEMLVGSPAFRGDTVSDVLAAVVRDSPDWTTLPTGTPACIHRLLRRCLRKDPRQRLQAIGDARIEIDAIDEMLPMVSEPSEARRARTTWGPWLALAILAASFGAWEAGRPAPEANPFANAQFSRLTDWEGSEGSAEISPDGKFIAFLADRDGEFDLWLTQMSTGEFRTLTANFPTLGGPHHLIRDLGFSGDGAEVWFSTGSDPVLSRKMIMPVAGGTPRVLLAEGDAAPSWSSDNVRLAYFRSGGDPLFIADRTGGDARQIAIKPSDPGDWSVATRMHNHNPVWSPDDQWLYFVHGSSEHLNWTDEMDVWRVRPGGGSPERLTHQNTAVTFLTPLTTNIMLYVARAENGSGPWLWALDTRTKTTRRVTSGLEQYTSVAASRDGRHIVATVVKPSAALWSVPILERPATDRDVQMYPVPTVRALAPRFGGTSLFYLSARGTADGVWRYQNEQAFELRKGADGPLFDPPAASRDGTRVAVVLPTNERRRRLAIMSSDGTGLRGVAESIDIQGTADWSPDGAWIVTGGNDAQGPALFKIPADGGPVVRLVSGQATDPVWSPNGDLIVYAAGLVTGQVAPLRAVRPDGASVELPHLEVRPGGQRFLPNGTGLVYLPRSQSLDFWLLDLRTKRTRQLTSLSTQGRLGRFDVTPGFDITPDGARIVFDRSREDSDIVLIDLPKY
jgi:serine/threonine protein kinase/Tol biopolymer transport system component